MRKNSSLKTRLATKVIHEGYEPEPLAACVAPPIYMSTTYAQDGVGGHKGYEYARSNNPTREMLEKNMSALEEAYGSCAFASGMAAISTLIQDLNQGDHIICCASIYGGSYRVFTKVFARHGFQFSFVDTTCLKTVEEAFNSRTKLVFVESPTNPLMEISDIRAICELAHKNGAQVCVDNTFMTPYLQSPINMGADYVVHSATKYLGGHSDVIGGILCMKNKEDWERIRFIQKSVGAVLSPFDSWLLLRGIKTLAVRMRAHEENANKVAAFLDSHPKVSKVFYPGLSNHPQHLLAQKQACGFGGMLSFELKQDKVKEFLKGLNIFLLAESLGAVESLVCIPAKMTHASIPAEERLKVGITDNLIRLSVGIEDAEDLIADLKAALELV